MELNSGTSLAFAGAEAARDDLAGRRCLLDVERCFDLPSFMEVVFDHQWQTLSLLIFCESTLPSTFTASSSSSGSWAAAIAAIFPERSMTTLVSFPSSIRENSTVWAPSSSLSDTGTRRCVTLCRILKNGEAHLRRF